MLLDSMEIPIDRKWFINENLGKQGFYKNLSIVGLKVYISISKNSSIIFTLKTLKVQRKKT